MIRVPIFGNNFNEFGSWGNPMPSVDVRPPSCGSRKVHEAQAAPTASASCLHKQSCHCDSDLLAGDKATL